MVHTIDNPRLQKLHDEYVMKVIAKYKAEGYCVTYADVPGYDQPHLVNGKKPDIIAAKSDPENPFSNIEYITEVELCGLDPKRTEVQMLAFSEERQMKDGLRVHFAAPAACMDAFKALFAQYGLAIDAFIIL